MEKAAWTPFGAENSLLKLPSGEGGVRAKTPVVKTSLAQTLRASALTPTVPAAAPPQATAPDPQSEPGEQKLDTPGNKYRYEYEYPVGERFSFKFRFVVSQTNPNMANTKAGRKKASLGESKMTIKKTAGRATSFAIAEAVANASLEQEFLWPGVKIKADLTALEAEYSKGNIDFNVFKIGVGVEGVLTEAIGGTEWGQKILDTEIGEMIKAGLSVTVNGKVELKVDPADAVRLSRAIKYQWQISKNAAQAIKTKALIQRHIDNNLSLQKKLNRKLSKYARARITKQLANNKAVITNLEKKIIESKTVTRRLMPLLSEAKAGLKSKAGRLVGKAVGKFAGKFLARLVPGLNIIMTVLDIVDLVDKIYDLATGKTEIGFGGGDAGEVKDEGEEGAGMGEDAGASSEEDDRDAAALDAEAKESLVYKPDAGLADARSGQGKGKGPELHPAANAIFESIKSSPGVGARFTAEDLAQLNDIVPKNLTSEQMAAVMEMLKGGKGEATGDAFVILGAIQKVVSQMNNPAPVLKISAETPEGNKTETISGPEATPPLEKGKEPEKSKLGTQEDLVKYIADAKPRLAGDGAMLISLQTLVQKKDVKVGMVLRGMIALMERKKYYGGYVVFIITEVQPGNGKYVINRLAADVYDEAGNKKRLKAMEGLKVTDLGE
jgi:hypothetical protein